MSAGSLPKTGRLSRSDSVKVVDAIPMPVGQPSGEIYDSDDDYYPPNNWARIRLVTSIIYYSSLMLILYPSEIIREPAAEMLGTMILTLVGCGANCQAVLSTNTGVASSPKGDAVTSAFGWACG